MVHAMALHGVARHSPGSDSDLDSNVIGEIIQDISRIAVLQLLPTLFKQKCPPKKLEKSANLNRVFN